jgi:hypothetical protein
MSLERESLENQSLVINNVKREQVPAGLESRGSQYIFYASSY